MAEIMYDKRPDDPLVIESVTTCPHADPAVLKTQTYESLYPSDKLLTMCRAGGTCLATFETTPSEDRSRHTEALGDVCMKGNTSRLSRY